MQRRLILVMALTICLLAITGVTLLSVLGRIDTLAPPAQGVERAPPPAGAAPAARSAHESLLLQRPLGRRTKQRVLRGQILLALGNHRSTLDQCLPASTPDFGGARLSLEVQLLDGKTRIEEVDVIDPGSSAPPVIECARTALRGQELATPIAAATAMRTRVVFPLDGHLRRVPARVP